jgi:hypothetical protein
MNTKDLERWLDIAIRDFGPNTAMAFFFQVLQDYNYYERVNTGNYHDSQCILLEILQNRE